MMIDDIKSINVLRPELCCIVVIYWEVKLGTLWFPKFTEFFVVLNFTMIWFSLTLSIKHFPFVSLFVLTSSLDYEIMNTKKNLEEIVGDVRRTQNSEATSHVVNFYRAHYVIHHMFQPNVDDSVPFFPQFVFKSRSTTFLGIFINAWFECFSPSRKEISIFMYSPKHAT